MVHNTSKNSRYPYHNGSQSTDGLEPGRNILQGRILTSVIGQVAEFNKKRVLGGDSCEYPDCVIGKDWWSWKQV